MSVTSYLTQSLSNYVDQRPDGGRVSFYCDTEAELPTTGVNNGDIAYTLDSNKRWDRTGGAWELRTTDNLANAILLPDESVLDVGAITDGQFLKRVGTDIVSAAVAGGGDLLAANNLSDLANAGTARTNLGLGSAATTASTAYATAAQGATADAAQVALVSGTNIKTVNSSSLLGSGDLVVSASSQLIVPLHADGSANITMTNQANAEQFLANSNRNITQADLTNYTQYRLVARVVTASASANTPRIYAQYRTSYSTTASDYSPLGDSGDVNVSLASAGLIKTAWTNLASGAKADVFLTVMQNGGDAAADPAVAQVVI